MLRLMTLTTLAGAVLAAAVPVLADEVDDRETITRDVEDSWYYQPSTQPTPVYKPNPRAIIQHKAQVRAQQRQDRQAALSWYGMSNSRPTAAPTPFTSLYSPVWQSPGGRPFMWYTTGRPTYIVR